MKKYKEEAVELLALHKKGQTNSIMVAIATIKPNKHAKQMKLKHARLAVAKRHGYKNWPALKRAVA